MERCAMKKISIPVFRYGSASDFPLPAYATEESAGMDLYAAIPGSITIPPAGRERISTGISIALPSGYEAQIRSRSGLAWKEGIIVLNSPGTIDADYRGEIFVVLYNTGDKVFLLKRGMRIAQMVIAPVVQAQWHEIGKLDTTRRGSGGFGSTGV